MTSFKMTPIRPDDRKAFIASDDGIATIKAAAADALETAIAPWLAQLVLLQGIPFQHLAPVGGMLPMESIRFFQVDPNWIDCAIDGAMSIGIASSADMALQDAIIADLRAAARSAAGLPTAQTAMSGFLLRSSLVAEMPDMVIAATGNSGALTTLAATQPSPDVLFVLFAGTATTVTLAQPQTGFSIGFESDSDADCGFGVQMRSLIAGAAGTPIAAPADGGGQQGDSQTGGEKTASTLVALDSYIDATNVVQLSRLAAALTGYLVTAGGLAATQPLSAGGFAVQLVAAPESQPFTIPWQS